MRRCLPLFFSLFLLLAGVSFAQFESLALSKDGTDLLFTSNLVLREDTDALSSDRFYRYAPSKPERIGVAPPNYRFTGAYLSSDGQTRGQYCQATYSVFFRSGLSISRLHGLCLERKGKAMEFFSSTGSNLATRISRNGRYLWQASSSNFSREAVVLDLENGTRMEAPPVYALHYQNAVSDNGTIVSTPPNYAPGSNDLSQNRGVALSPTGQPTRVIYEGDRVSSAAISPDGRYAFLRTQPSSDTYALLEIDTATGNQRTILEATGDFFEFSLDQDAGHVLMRHYQSLEIWDRASNTTRRLVETPDYIRSAVLSDDGGTVAYLRADGSISRIHTATAARQELYGPTPIQLERQGGIAYPGSAVLFRGSGFQPDSQVESNGSELKLFRIDTRNIAEQDLQIQIPWDFPVKPSNENVIVARNPNSPFVLRAAVNLASQPYPGFFGFFDDAKELVVTAATQDFSGLHSSARPAPAGSTIHVYLSGLGPTDLPLATGQTGPSDPPAVPLAKPTCFLRDFNANGPRRQLEMPFLAYAAGLIGVYQADLVIPIDFPAGRHELSCTLDGEDFSRSQLFTSRP